MATIYGHISSGQGQSLRRHVDAVIYYLIADPVRATYEVQNLA